MDDEMLECTDWNRSTSSDESNSSTRKHQLTDELAAFDEKSFAEDLIMRSLRDEDITLVLRKHWVEMVPKCYRYGDDLKLGIIDNNDEKVLFYPLKALLCEDTDPAAILEILKMSNKNKTVCGHIFDSEEPLYHCRSCAIDSTCVLCGNCFFNSDHRNHRYRMSCSSGGGLCDCGDVDAWTQSVYCDLHKPKEQHLDKEYWLNLLPKQNFVRAKKLFSFLMNYAVDCLCLLDSVQLPAHLISSHPSEEYVTMLLNDEIHSYGEVIGCLVTVLKIFRSAAYDLATLVDKEGRSAVKIGSFQECSEVKDFIDNNVSTRRQPPLRTNVMNTDIVAHQSFSIKLIKWLEDIVQYSEVFRHLLCDVICEEVDGTESSLLRRMLLNDDVFWKSARATCHSLFVKCFFMDPESKKVLGKAYIESYSDIWRHFIEGYDENFSFAELSVQLLTVPNLACYLIKEYSAFEVIASLFAEYCESYLKKDGYLSFQGQYASHEFRKAQNILFDLKYLVSSVNVNNCCGIEENFLKGMKSFIKILDMLQGMDPSIRQPFHHLETNPEWETCFNISMRLYYSIKILLNLCVKNKDIAIEVFKALLNSLKAYTERKNCFYGYEEVTCFNHSSTCITFCVMRDPVSVHYPTSRFLSAHFFNLQSLNALKEGIALFTDKLPLYWLFEHALRVRVLAAQCNAGLWKRNGSSIMNQLLLYTNIRCREEMFDRDLTALQMGASLLEPNEFLLHMLHRYNITKWLSVDGLILFKNNAAIYTYRQLAVMIEDFLELIIFILCERYQPGVGKVDKMACLQMEIIHALCYRSLTHNELTRAVMSTGIDDEDMKIFNEAIQNVADIKKSFDTSKVTYEAKEECITKFNPYFYHYTREERAKAEENCLEFRSKKKLSKCILIPLPPPFTETFSNVLNLLQCDLMLHVFNMVLVKSLVIPSTSVWTEGQLRKVLHLIGLALFEQRRSMASNDDAFQFIKREQELFNGNIFHNIQLVILSEKTDISPSVRELASEILKIYQSVNEKSAAYESFLTQYKNDQKKKVQSVMKRKEQALARRNKAVADMTNLQRKFIQANKELYENTVVEQELTGKSDVVEMEPVDQEVICLGPNYTHTESFRKSATCIVCQETQEISFDNVGIGLLGFAQKSNLFSYSKTSVAISETDFNPQHISPGFTYGIHVNTCGHYMHLSCYESYSHNAGRNYRQSFISSGRNFLPFDPEGKECLCPLCNAISNILIPALPSMQFSDQNIGEEKSFEDWFKCISEVRQDLQLGDLETFNIFKTSTPIQDAMKVLSDYVASNLENLFGTKDSLSRKIELSDSVNKLITDAADSLRTVTGYSGEYAETTAKVSALHIWIACCYTIQSLVNLMESENRNVYSDVSIQNEALLEGLIGLSALYQTKLPLSALQSISTDLLTIVFLPELCRSEKSLLNLNMFDMLISFSLSLPSLVAKAEFSSINNYRHITFWYTLRLFFAIHCIQVLAVSDWTFEATDIDADVDEDSRILYTLYVMVKDFLKKPFLSSECAKCIRSRLIKSVLPFLRCCCLFYKTLFRNNFSCRLSEGFKLDKENASLHSCEEYKSICAFLSLPTNLSELFKEMPDSFTSKIRSWCESCKNCLIPVCYPVNIQRLTTLPKDYVSLLALTVSDRVLNEMNPAYQDDSHVVSICLLCGDIIISTPQKVHMRFDSRVGMSVMHTLECGIHCGIFLRIKECIVAFINIISKSPLKARGAFHSAPYVDEYGDTDDGLKRGNPLFFSNEIYNKLQRIWLSHGIPDIISRTSQTQQIALATNWDLV